MKMTEEYSNGMKLTMIESEETCEENYDSLWQKQLRFHDLYLQDGAFEFLVPIHFEDGMDFEECESYYASINDGPTRSVYKRKPTRRKTKDEIRDEVNGLLPSCLRKSSRKHPDVLAKERPPLRRTVSFSAMPSDSSLHAENLAEFMRDSVLGPNVTFEEYTTVATIYAIDDYPDDVRANVWMSREELSRCMRRAMVEEMKERRERERDALSLVEQPVVEPIPAHNPSPSRVVHMMATSGNNDDSYDVLDLVKCHNECTRADVESIPMSMRDTLLSQ